MAATGKRVAALRKALEQTGLSALSSKEAPPRPQPSQLPAKLKSELLALYEQLGGTAAAPPLRPGPWDLAFSGGLVVELDEELHFNRYRAATLAASWEAALPWTEAYCAYCDANEHACWKAGRWGGRWTNPSAAKMFSGGPAGELEGPGAPRWKQRALYDALKDTAPLVYENMRLARLATHDTITGVALDDILSGGQPIDAPAVRALVESRAA